MDRSPHPLRDYALIADGERGALIGPRGEYAWMCAPRWDSGAVFAGLIGGPGGYRVVPVQRCVPSGSYREGTLIWCSRWITAEGAVECQEALALPGDPHTAVILRRIGAREAAADVEVALSPYAEFGSARLEELHRDDQGVWTGRLGERLWLRWSGAADARTETADGAPELRLRLEVRPDAAHDLVLELSDRPFRDPPPDPEETWRATERAWADEVPEFKGGLARRDARQAHAVLRGLTSAGGGMVAAATTGLPEAARAQRNYDYRYVWIRDLCYCAQALAAGAEPPALLDRQVGFVTARLLEHGPGLSPAYTPDGRPIPEPHSLDLPGYPGGRGVVGNRVAGQRQLDVFGEALQLFGAAAGHGRLNDQGWSAARLAVRAIAEQWGQADNGVWELDLKPWAHSRLACAAGLRSFAACASGREREHCTELAARLVDWTERNCTHPSGRWQRAPDDPRADAALLLPAVRGAVGPQDPRTERTVRACAAELTEDHFAYRFRHDERPLGSAEGAFLVCGFVMALAEHQVGREVDAHRWFERNRAACGPPGLYAEEYDVPQRQLRGNLPQAFVHGLLLECAERLPGAPQA